jgi:5'-3' exonuclease
MTESVSIPEVEKKIKNIIVDTQSPVIIIDISILFYSAYFEAASKFYLANGDTQLAQRDMMKEIRAINAPNLATFKTLAALIVRRADTIDYTTLYENSAFIELFNKVIQRLIKNITTTVSQTPYKYGNTLLIKDCRRANNWRLQQYPLYKQLRASRDIITNHLQFNGKIVEQFWKDIYPQLQNRIGIKEISLENMEADDMAYFTKLKLQELHPNIEIILVTRDYDYLQLADKYTKIINFEGIDLNNRTNTLTSNTNLTIKILTGDASDNIPPIYNGCGEKRAAVLLALLYETNFNNINKAAEQFINDINNASNIRNVATNILSVLTNNIQSRTKGKVSIITPAKMLTLDELYSNLYRNIHLIQMSKIPSVYLDTFNKKYNFKAYDTALSEFEVIVQKTPLQERSKLNNTTTTKNKAMSDNIRSRTSVQSKVKAFSNP